MSQHRINWFQHVNNYKPKSEPCQQKKHTSLFKKALTLKRFLFHLSNYRSDKQNTIIKSLDFLIIISFQGAQVFPRQATIGEFADITREHANRILQELARLGIVRIINRGYDTCLYQLHPDFFGYNRFQFADYFPVLKTLALGLLMSINSPSRSETITQRILGEQSILKNSKYTIRKDSYAMLSAHALTDILYADTQESIKMQVFTQIQREIARKYQFTLYATIVITGFDSDTLEKAYKLTDAFIKNQGRPDHIFKLFYSYCEKIYKMQDKQINWMDVKLRLEAANCHPGMPLLKSDVESQPRYEDPATPLKRERPATNSFLKMFPVPTEIKENDTCIQQNIKLEGRQ